MLWLHAATEVHRGKEVSNQEYKRELLQGEPQCRAHGEKSPVFAPVPELQAEDQEGLCQCRSRRAAFWVKEMVSTKEEQEATPEHFQEHANRVKLRDACLVKKKKKTLDNQTEEEIGRKSVHMN